MDIVVLLIGLDLAILWGLLAGTYSQKTIQTVIVLFATSFITSFAYLAVRLKWSTWYSEPATIPPAVFCGFLIFLVPLNLWNIVRNTAKWSTPKVILFDVICSLLTAGISFMLLDAFDSFTMLCYALFISLAFAPWVGIIAMQVNPLGKNAIFMCIGSVFAAYFPAGTCIFFAERFSCTVTEAAILWTASLAGHALLLLAGMIVADKLRIRKPTVSA